MTDMDNPVVDENGSEETAPKQPPANDTIRLVPALTSFDLLEGAFAKARKNRMMLIAVLSLTALVTLLLIGQGLRASVDRSSVNSDIDAERGQVTLLTNQIRSSGQIAGLSTTAAATFVEGRANAAAQLTFAELNYAELTAELYETAPDGLHIVSVEYVTDAIPAEAALLTGAIVCPDGTVAVTNGSLADDPASPLARTTFVTMQAQHPGVNYEGWLRSIRDLGVLTDVIVSETGSQPDFSLNITARLAQHAHSDRALGFQGSLPDVERLNPCFEAPATSGPVDVETPDNGNSDTPGTGEEGRFAGAVLSLDELANLGIDPDEFVAGGGVISDPTDAGTDPGTDPNAEPPVDGEAGAGQFAGAVLTLEELDEFGIPVDEFLAQGGVLANSDEAPADQPAEDPTSGDQP